MTFFLQCQRQSRDAKTITASKNTPLLSLNLLTFTLRLLVSSFLLLPKLLLLLLPSVLFLK
jgi:hypothetical protein